MEIWVDFWTEREEFAALIFIARRDDFWLDIWDENDKVGDGIFGQCVDELAYRK